MNYRKAFIATFVIALEMAAALLYFGLRPGDHPRSCRELSALSGGFLGTIRRESGRHRAFRQ